MSPVRDRLPRWLPAVVATFWCAGTAYAFWSVDLRDRHPLDPATVAAYFDRTRTAPAAESWLRGVRPAIRPDGARPRRAIVVHVTRPGCACNDAAERHLAEIAARYGAAGVELTRAALPFVVAAPAALVFDAGGHLVYVGPYSEEADCGRSAGYVEGVLDDLTEGRPPRAPALLGLGCYCLS